MSLGLQLQLLDQTLMNITVRLLQLIDLYIQQDLLGLFLLQSIIPIRDVLQLMPEVTEDKDKVQKLLEHSMQILLPFAQETLFLDHFQESLVTLLNLRYTRTTL